jgi:hypothetical protein
VLDGPSELHKTARRSKAAYINQRMVQVSGKVVKTALLEMAANTKGNSVRYIPAQISTMMSKGGCWSCDIKPTSNQNGSIRPPSKRFEQNRFDWYELYPRQVG